MFSRKLLCFGFACDDRSLLGGFELFPLFLLNRSSNYSTRSIKLRIRSTTLPRSFSACTKSFFLSDSRLLASIPTIENKRS